LVVIGISERRIGVDVEEIRPIDDLPTIAETYFTRAECSFLFQHPPADRMQAFFRCWTRKEACIKAVGKGLSIALNSFDTLIDSGQVGRFIARALDSSDAASWWLADLRIPRNYMAAVAIETVPSAIVYRRWRRKINEV
jgi:4'-phosphopantetheinyl transferase